METLARYAFSILCHQEPALVIASNVPLCPRCAGLHLAFFFTSAVFFLSGTWVVIRGKAEFAVLVAMLTVPALHWTLVASLDIAGAPLLRMLAGLLGGSAAATLVRASRRDKTDVRSIGGWCVILGAVPIVCALGLLIRYEGPPILLSTLLILALMANAGVFASAAVRSMSLRPDRRNLNNPFRGVLT